MLQATFQHIKGIGSKTEFELWRKGITDWRSCQKRVNGKQLPLFQGLKVDPIDLSIEALRTDNISFFAERLPRREHYRIALAYPAETMFLDIEKTGLSLHYDQLTLVGWSVGSKYGVYLKDEKEHGLREALGQAKAIVTFNGSIFDLKFLEKTFKNLPVPQVHIDLRFFVRRAGLSGGQKQIEHAIGFTRHESVRGMEGETAPLLWYRYRRGDLKALEDLVTYNHADIEGMKWIFDYSVDRLFERENIPSSVGTRPRFSKHRSEIVWATSGSANASPYEIRLKPNKEHLGPLIDFEQLNQIVPLEETTFIGIDIVSSEDRDSGYCILKGNRADTCRVKTDAAMIRMALDAGATLVSIDSPLSIPHGRTSFFDDDPQRDKFGIMRECERILKKRGVNVYPCLIPSMQKLTRRGIRLAEKLRKLGIPVIESYPGAAQDIMGIPRKRAGLDYLADALVEFGIRGDFETTQISHDELDAITAAIVGLFFWTGKFEAIGNFDEDYLIIPDLNTDPSEWVSRKVIGLSGVIGSGKTTAADFLVKCGFTGARFSWILEGLLPGNSTPASRSELQNIGRKIYTSGRQRWLGKTLLEPVQQVNKLFVDGLRFPEDHALMVETFGPSFLHIFIDTLYGMIPPRIKDHPKEDLSVKEARSSFTESKTEDLKILAHKILLNDSDVPSFYQKIRQYIE